MKTRMLWTMPMLLASACGVADEANDIAGPEEAISRMSQELTFIPAGPTGTTGGSGPTNTEAVATDDVFTDHFENGWTKAGSWFASSTITDGAIVLIADRDWQALALNSPAAIPLGKYKTFTLEAKGPGDLNVETIGGTKVIHTTAGWATYSVTIANFATGAYSAIFIKNWPGPRSFSVRNIALQKGSTGPSSNPVVSRVERAGPVFYKIYLQATANAANRKGMVLLGSGNDESDPTTGSLEGALENNTANELAKRGYVAAIVGYRDEPPLVPNDGGVSWNSNCAMLATDMSQVANAIIATVGGGLSRNRVIMGGVSYASYALLTNIADNATPLVDTKGVLATCGATGDFQARNFKRPISNLNCSGNPEGDFNGQALYDKITNAAIKAESGFFTDFACNTNCGGDINTWTGKMVERVQLWLP